MQSLPKKSSCSCIKLKRKRINKQVTLLQSGIHLNERKLKPSLNSQLVHPRSSLFGPRSHTTTTFFLKVKSIYTSLTSRRDCLHLGFQRCIGSCTYKLSLSKYRVCDCFAKRHRPRLWQRFCKLLSRICSYEKSWSRTRQIYRSLMSNGLPRIKIHHVFIQLTRKTKWDHRKPILYVCLIGFLWYHGVERNISKCMGWNQLWRYEIN